VGAWLPKQLAQKADLSLTVFNGWPQNLLAGHINRHVPGLYAQAKALVAPSLYEGSGFPKLENMAGGIPSKRATQ
jgi:glycosyltransferase involved in cell wall biosynthesis